MNRYVRTFKNKDGNKDKNKNNKLMPSCIHDAKLLEKQKTIWIKV